MSSHEIILALQSQVECYRRLAKLAVLQHEHVQRGATEELLEVLGLRQQVLEQLSQLEKTVIPAKRQWASYVAGLDEPSRRLAEQLLAETRRLLEEITQADRNDALVLQQRKLNLGREIGQASAARQVNRSYATAAYGVRQPSMDLQR